MTLYELDNKTIKSVTRCVSLKHNVHANFIVGNKSVFAGSVVVNLFFTFSVSISF